MTIRLKQLLAAGMLAAAMLPPSPAGAAPVMDADADNLVKSAGFIKDTLGLTSNQHTLWQQVAARSAAALRARQQRRDKLQAALKSQLQDPSQELRSMAAAIEAEAALSAQENSALRELWLTVHDALDDRQRLAVSQFLVTQLDRVDAPQRAPGASRGEGQPGGGPRQKPGGDMGGRSRF